MKDLIEYVIKALVDHPEQVELIETKGQQITILELKVAKEDMGKVIGRHGQTARAIRTILSAASAKLKTRTLLELIE
ncbi:MAG: KH domain-containing protein [Desulfobacterales bacterium]